MKYSITAVCLLSALLSFASCLPTAHALIVYSGDIDPAEPNTWTSSTTAYVGKTGEGNVEVNGDSDLLSGVGYVGYESAGRGHVTVTGTGSTWHSASGLSVGAYGSGTVTIASGGVVSISKYHSGSIGYGSGSTGLVTVDGKGSKWTGADEIVVGYGGSGMLTITDGGTVLNATGSCIGGYDYSNRSGSGKVTVNGNGSTWSNNGELRVGSFGSGTLKITAGGAVTNASRAWVGYNGESMGMATVDGEGSTWTINSGLKVGYFGTGILSITNGGVVSNSDYGGIGDKTGSTGVVTVQGRGST